MGCPRGSDSKESACSAGDLDSIPELGRSPREGNGNPLQHSYLHAFLPTAIYSPWGRKELDTTEQLTLHNIPIIGCLLIIFTYKRKHQQKPTYACQLYYDALYLRLEASNTIL